MVGFFPPLKKLPAGRPNLFSLFACTRNVKFTGRSGNSFVGRMGKALGDGLLTAGAAAASASQNN